MAVENGGGGSGGGVRRRGCNMFERNDFFPEESFKSWGDYGRAFVETPFRLKERVLTRSKDHTELVEMKARSNHEMKKTLSWWDLIWFGIGAVIGSGIFVLHRPRGSRGGRARNRVVICCFGISALLSVFCYTEFSVEIPVAGGSFAYLRVELGDFVAFIAAGNILLEYVIGAAAVARSWTSYFATLCNKNPNDFRIIVQNMNPDFNHLDPIAVFALIAIATLAVCSTKASSFFNKIATVFHLFVLAFIVVVGLTNAKPENYTPFAPFGTRGVFKASAVLFFAYIGFDAVSTMAEETKNPGKDIPIGLVGSMVIITFIYCLLAITLCLMQDYKTIDIDAPFSVAFSSVGWGWAKYIVALGALKGMTTVLLVNVVGASRYLTHIARTHMMPPWFALVNDRTGTPLNATIAMVSATCVIAFFTNLRILSNLLSISTLSIFMLVAVGILVRRYYSSGVTTKKNQVKLIVCLLLIIGSSCGMSGYRENSDGWIGWVITVSLWVLGTGGIWLGVPQAKQPKVWGVPLVPWLPSLSIVINIFLLGSIDKASYIRFGIWTGIILIYYVLFGLHASYDAAKEFETRSSMSQEVDDKELKNAEEGA